jgi:hypothetical protein
MLRKSVRQSINRLASQPKEIKPEKLYKNNFLNGLFSLILGLTAKRLFIVMLYKENAMMNKFYSNRTVEVSKNKDVLSFILLNS